MLKVIIRLFQRLFDNLLRKAGDIAVALHARGYISPEQHTIYTGSARTSSLNNNIICSVVIAALVAQAVLLP